MRKMVKSFLDIVVFVALCHLVDSLVFQILYGVVSSSVWHFSPYAGVLIFKMISLVAIFIITALYVTLTKKRPLFYTWAILVYVVVEFLGLAVTPVDSDSFKSFATIVTFVASLLLGLVAIPLASIICKSRLSDFPIKDNILVRYGVIVLYVISLVAVFFYSISSTIQLYGRGFG